MLEQLSDDCSWANDENCVQFLNWAADLHEIGIDIAHSQYHKHSAYIIENGDLAGFSKQDQILLATIIRLHRRKFSQALFNRFTVTLECLRTLPDSYLAPGSIAAPQSP